MLTFILKWPVSRMYPEVWGIMVKTKARHRAPWHPALTASERQQQGWSEVEP